MYVSKNLHNAIVLEVGLDQLSYFVGEENGSVHICVVALAGAPTLILVMLMFKPFKLT